MPDSKDNLPKEDATSGGIPGFAEEEAYWREKHSTQSYASKTHTYDDYAPAYRTAYEGFPKHEGKKFEEIEDDLALDYEKATAGSALPWDTVRPAVKAAWDKVSGMIPPRQPDRGIRGFI